MSTRVRDLLQERSFLTNAGTETYLIFQQGFELPEFCAFTVFDDEGAWSSLQRNLLGPTLQVAADHGLGLLVDALVWRAQPDFVEKLGLGADRLVSLNERAVRCTRDAVDAWRRDHGHDERSLPVLVAADLGPRGDGYKVDDTQITPEAARAYHEPQVAAVAAAGVDLAYALTMTSAGETIGIVQACTDAGLPIIASPTVETDGRLPDGSTLGEFVGAVDDATGGAPLFYMVNCAHPSHLRPALDAARQAGEEWLSRFRGFRSNASRKSHEELDNSTELDRGDVEDLAREVAALRVDYGLAVVGGCCGTDHEHLAAMASA